MKQILWPAFLIVLFFSSCTVYREYPIDVYKPGEIVVPPNIKSVALVYRNFKYPADTLQHYYKNNYQLRKVKNDPKNLDSILVSYCLNELANKLKEEKTVERINIFPELFKPHRGEKLPALNFDMVKRITQSSNTDLLISLETFSYFYSTYPPMDDRPKSNEVITAAVWAIYNPITEKIIDRKTLIDTLFWNGYDENGNYQKKSKLPPRGVALKIAAQMAGEKYAKRFSASWQTVNRMYSVPPLPDFSDAATYIEKGEWDNAILLWKRYANEKNGKMAINARYNIALGYEMKDQIELALKWLNSAQQLALSYKSREDLKMIASYKKELVSRIKDINRLNQSSQ